MALVGTDVDELYQRVRQQFLRGRGKTGRGLSRRQLAKELGVEPSSIRGILHRLEGEGIVELHHRSGTRVRQMTVEEYHEFHDLRELIEPYAAHRAARWITRAQAKRLKDCCAQRARFVVRQMACQSLAELEELGDQGMALEQTFHGTILEAARNNTAARLVENFHILAAAGYMAAELSLADHIENTRVASQEHEVIAAAICSGRADDAERCMREHLQKGRRRSFPNYQAQE